ncbi:MAG: hypothetical protein U0R49_11495 [Fimbriimonadales bacterium]
MSFLALEDSSAGLRYEVRDFKLWDAEHTYAFTFWKHITPKVAVFREKTREGQPTAISLQDRGCRRTNPLLYTVAAVFDPAVGEYDDSDWTFGTGFEFAHHRLQGNIGSGIWGNTPRFTSA